jgi:alpha-D-ribose 1-methylphosphonate 5-triphosphate synthase subunit PhnH
MSHSAVQPAFRDPPRDAQGVFRAVMNAMARPGRVLPFRTGFDCPVPLNISAAAILIALADYETPIWLDAALGKADGVTEFLRFHTGARIVGAAEEASFAVIADPAAAPPFTAFAHGAPDYPDRSATLIYQVERLTAEGWTLTGPGIAGKAALGAAPLPADFARQHNANYARYPLGVDVLFAAPGAIAALPRSTRIVEAR